MSPLNFVCICIRERHWVSNMTGCIEILKHWTVRYIKSALRTFSSSHFWGLSNSSVSFWWGLSFEHSSGWSQGWSSVPLHSFYILKLLDFYEKKKGREKNRSIIKKTNIVIEVSIVLWFNSVIVFLILLFLALLIKQNTLKMNLSYPPYLWGVCVLNQTILSTGIHRKLGQCWIMYYQSAIAQGNCPSSPPQCSLLHIQIPVLEQL